MKCTRVCQPMAIWRNAGIICSNLNRCLSSRATSSLWPTVRPHHTGEDLSFTWSYVLAPRPHICSQPASTASLLDLPSTNGEYWHRVVAWTSSIKAHSQVLGLHHQGFRLIGAASCGRCSPISAHCCRRSVPRAGRTEPPGGEAGGTRGFWFHSSGGSIQRPEQRMLDTAGS